MSSRSRNSSEEFIRQKRSNHNKSSRKEKNYKEDSRTYKRRHSKDEKYEQKIKKHKRSKSRSRKEKQSKKNHHNHKISSSESSDSRSRSSDHSRSSESDSRKKSVKKLKKNKENDQKIEKYVPRNDIDDQKRRQERRKRIYDHDVDYLKEQEQEKRREVELKRLQEIQRKEKEEQRRIERLNKKKEIVLTEEEKERLKKKSRLAKARLVARLDKEEEKKIEENYQENEDLFGDLIEAKTKDDDVLEKDEDEEQNNENNENSKVNQENFKKENCNEDEARIKDENSEISENNLSKGFNFELKIKSNGIHNDVINDDCKGDNKISSNKQSNVTIKGIESKKNEEEDPLDSYMRTIQDDATMQEYEIIQKYYNSQLQKRYDDLVDKEGEVEFDNEKEDDVQMIENKNENDQVDKSKVITYEEIMMQMKEKKAHEEVVKEKEEEEGFYQDFVTKLKEQKVEFDLKFESEEKKEDIIYEEDVNEYLKEEIFAEPEDFLAKAKKMNEKKDLKIVNHENVKYEPFNKNLYIECKEISNLTNEQIDAFKKVNGDIKVRGKNVPKPIMNWYQCGLSNRLLMVLEKKKFKTPFPIQSQSIPCIMSGRDVIGIAETGSGKTLAYVLPLIRHVLDQSPLKDGDGPIGLILAPTRELAYQIYLETKSFCKVLNLSCVCVYGGAGVGNQLSDLRRGAEIVICTPGRMIDVLCLSNGKITNLRRVTYVVIDEADRLFDMGFEPQIARILANIRPDRQTVLFSATFPKQIENLAKKILIKPIEIVVGNRGQTCSNVEQFVEIRDESTKFYRLLEILGEYSHKVQSILIFVDKQIEADELFKELLKLGHYCKVIHGGQDQEDRDDTISDFKNGLCNILIATSVCARGLDVKHLGLVVNFKCPNHMEDYVHRVGRTGRAGNKGIAYTFISPDDAHLAEDILRALELSNQKIPDELKTLVRNYKEKLENGEAEKFRNNGFYGRGYMFNDKEKDKISLVRKELSKTYGVGVDSDDDEEPEVKGGNDKMNENGNNNNQLAIPNNTKPKETEKKKNLLGMFKDPKAKQLAMDAGMMAAKNAIMAKKTEEEAFMIAQEAIEKVLQQYKPSVSTEKGMEQASKIIDEWVDRENEKNNIYTAELEINDYPTAARSKVCGREFMSSIYEMTGCNVCVRGSYVESGRKVPIGQKKLHLYIQGNSKIEVSSAYKEIKRIIDENALQYYTMGNTNGYTGNICKYQI